MRFCPVPEIAVLPEFAIRPVTNGNPGTKWVGKEIEEKRQVFRPLLSAPAAKIALR